MRFAGTELANYMNPMDHSKIAGTSMQGRSMERRAVMEGEGMVANYGLQSLGKVQSAEYQADSIKAQGQAQGQASMVGGIASGISNLMGAFG